MSALFLAFFRGQSVWQCLDGGSVVFHDLMEDLEVLAVSTWEGGVGVWRFYEESKGLKSRELLVSMQNKFALDTY